MEMPLAKFRGKILCNPGYLKENFLSHSALQSMVISLVKYVTPGIQYSCAHLFWQSYTAD